MYDFLKIGMRFLIRLYSTTFLNSTFIPFDISNKTRRSNKLSDHFVKNHKSHLLQNRGSKLACLPAETDLLPTNLDSREIWYMSFCWPTINRMPSKHPDRL